jgi:membrane-associated protein
LNETLLQFLSTYGALALSPILVLAALGVPLLPATLLLLATGALAADLGFSLPIMMATGLASSVTGDQLGYWVGRLAGKPLRPWIKAKPVLATKMRDAEALMQKRGAVGVFLTRWLITPAGPYINLVSGLLDYPWWKFTLAGILGEAVWVALYIGLGTLAGEGIEEIAAIAGDVTWVVIAAAVALFMAYQLMKKEKTQPVSEQT